MNQIRNTFISFNSKDIKNYKGTPRGFLPHVNDQPKIYSAGKVRFFDDSPVTLL